jgi:SAM-dependent methyltransferase
MTLPDLDVQGARPRAALLRFAVSTRILRMIFDIRSYNRQAWDKAVERRSEWTVPVEPQAIAAARSGDWQIVLTPTKPIPRAWFGEIRGADVLCLAGGGGQQGPILAAAGARVTVFDNSPQQLAQDRYVARREGLELQTVEGDMRDLSIFAGGSFDLIVHPVSNVFVPDVHPVWREAARVLRRGGSLLAGFTNPILYLFDQELADEGTLQVRHKLPYSDLTSLSEEERAVYVKEQQPLEFGHLLADQIGGQIDAGFVIAGFYEDIWPGTAINEFTPTYIATRAVKLDINQFTKPSKRKRKRT